jgi:hypothetical protein
MSDLALSICVSYVSYTSDSIARSPILRFRVSKVGLLELYILIKKPPHCIISKNLLMKLQAYWQKCVG